MLRQARRLPGWARVGSIALALFVVWLTANALYQVLRKPAELFFPVRGALNKTPAETWREYEPIFREHATATVTPELLAALAQVEAAGNPLATPDWRLKLAAQPFAHPFSWYRPASSAVGMYQITDGTLAQAKRYCIHWHAVVEEGPWHDWRSCWFNALYLRVVPSHAAEMTSAFLDRRVSEILQSHSGSATLEQRQDLAALVHLCGPGAGALFVAANFRLRPGQRCGEHDAAAYLAQVKRMKRVFAALSAERSR